MAWPIVPRVSALLALCVVATCGDPAPATGSMIIQITGLPASVAGTVVVNGPAGFRRIVPATTTLEQLPPGDYVVSSTLITAATALYEPEIPSRIVSVVAGQTQSVLFNYLLASGSIMLSAAGLPDGIGPTVSVASASFLRVVSAAGLIPALPPGDYIVRADTFAAATGDRYGATVVQQNVKITASETPVPVSFSYGPASGTIGLVVTGLQTSFNDAVTVTGPQGYSFSTSVSTSLRGLRPGTYSVTPRRVVDCPNVFGPLTSPYTVDVAIAQTTEAAVAYQAEVTDPGALNLSIASAYLTQTVQNASGTLPIVAGRPALLRVFGVANQCNAARPSVKVRFSNGDSIMIPAPEAAVRFEATPMPLGTSWNAFLPADRVQSGLTFEAVIDADESIPEADENDNRFPPSGPSTQPVVTMPPLDITFVPITQSNVTGVVTTANLPEYMRAVQQMLPIGEINAVIAPPFTTQVVLGNGSATAFASILEDLEAKRVQDAGQSGYTGHYYGVLRPSPGVTFVQLGGIAYRPGKTALGIMVGWFNDASQATELVAHELGHNFNQRHAPCGGAGSPDLSYPYTGGAIGQPGYDLSTATSVAGVAVKASSSPDIMGYCDNPWISDYMYGRIIDYRNSAVAAIAARNTASTRTTTLMLRGMVSPDSARLEPAFEIETRPALPSSAGPHVVEGRAADGSVLFRTAFSAQLTDHGLPDVAYFTFAIPLASSAIAQLDRVDLIARGRRVTRRSTGSAPRVRLLAPDALPAASGASVVARSGSVIEVEWDVKQWQSVLVRDPATRALLAIGHGGRASVVTGIGIVELVLSDGARSVTIQMPVAGR